MRGSIFGLPVMAALLLGTQALAVDVTGPGQTVPAGQVGVLTADLVCDPPGAILQVFFDFGVRIEIAEVAHMSPHYFSRAFRNSTGLPPHRYVINRRIEKAKTLLSDNHLPLVEVGLSVGFQNQSHFTTLFHKRTGVTPKVYRSRS